MMSDVIRLLPDCCGLVFACHGEFAPEQSCSSLSSSAGSNLCSQCRIADASSAPLHMCEAYFRQFVRVNVFAKRTFELCETSLNALEFLGCLHLSGLVIILVRTSLENLTSLKQAWAKRMIRNSKHLRLMMIGE